MTTARQKAGGHRRLTDFPAVVAERSKDFELSQSLRVVDERIDEAKRSLNRFPESKNEAVATAGKQVLAGADIDLLLKQHPTDRTSIRAYVEELEFRRDVIRSALIEQREILRRIEGECAHEIFKDVRPQHERLLSDILDHLLALSDALEAESEFNRRMQTEGIPLGLAPQVSDLVSKIGFRRVWSSSVNDIWRRVAIYIGRPWDHSTIPR